MKVKPRVKVKQLNKPYLSVEFGDKNRYRFHEEMTIVTSYNLTTVSSNVQRAALRVQREEVYKT